MAKVSKRGERVDKVLDDLYAAAKEDFEKKLQVAREMVKLEMQRLKADDEGGETPDFYKEETNG